MLLDTVLDDHDVVWLGRATDKRRHFMRHLVDRLGTGEFPHVLFGDGPAKTVRYFPDKLPIGVLPGLDSHVFVYLVTHPSPMDFRLFLLRHIALFRVLFRWTVRLLLPRQLAKARLAYLHAAREHLATPVDPSSSRPWTGCSPNESVSPNRAPRLRTPASSRPPAAYRLPRFRALYRQWSDDPRNTLWMAGSPILAEAIDREHGRVECVELSRQYLHLSPLVDVA